MTVSPTTSLLNPADAAGARTTVALVEQIRRALDGDGSYVLADSIDSQGLSVVAGIYRFRVELGEPELLDWDQHGRPEPAEPDSSWTGDDGGYDPADDDTMPRHFVLPEPAEPTLTPDEKEAKKQIAPFSSNQAGPLSTEVLRGTRRALDSYERYRRLA